MSGLGSQVPAVMKRDGGSSPDHGWRSIRGTLSGLWDRVCLNPYFEPSGAFRNSCIHPSDHGCLGGANALITTLSSGIKLNFFSSLTKKNMQMLSILGKPSHLSRPSVKLNCRNELNAAENWFEFAVLFMGKQRAMIPWPDNLLWGSVSHCHQPRTNNL